MRRPIASLTLGTDGLLARMTTYTLAACFVSAGLWLVAGPDARQPRSSDAMPRRIRPVGLYKPAASNPTRAIQDVRVGERVMAGNPEATEGTEAEVDQAIWRKIDLVMPKGDNTRFDTEIVLLRPLGWIEDLEVAVGRSVELRMPEMGAVGPALIRSIEPCPPIHPGCGRVVTGTFTHDSDSVLNLRLEGSEETIGVTPAHPIYSEDRQNFVAAGELITGERLSPLTGLAQVKSVDNWSGVTQVYNLEVNVEHVYRVTASGLLVHNASPSPYKDPKSGLSGKQGAKDVPSWVQGQRPLRSEDGNAFATRLMDCKYGKGNYNNRSGEYSKIRKYGDRNFE